MRRRSGYDREDDRACRPHRGGGLDPPRGAGDNRRPL